MSVAALLEKAAQLDEKELEAFLQRVKALKAIGGGKPDQEAGETATEMYHWLKESVRKARGISLPPIHVLRSDPKGWRKFSLAAKEAEETIQSLETDRVKKLALRKWCCNLIVHKIIEEGYVLGRNSLTWGMLNLPAILEGCFPGYMASGLMPYVLKSLYSGTKRKLRRVE